MSGLGLQLLLVHPFRLQQRSQPRQAAAVLPGGLSHRAKHCERHQRQLQEAAGRTAAA